jgi:hypothetical protein
MSDLTSSKLPYYLEGKSDQDNSIPDRRSLSLRAFGAGGYDGSNKPLFKDNKLIDLKEYDALIFSDCLVQYNIVEVQKLVIETHLAELHESLYYPKEITEFEYEKDD